MKLNLKYYNGEDKYSDGDVENDIIKYIEKNSNEEYESIFNKDIRWPVYYHLSPIRQNILSWYPFDKDSSILEIGAGMGAITELLIDKVNRVVSVELSKRRATAIQKRCKNAKNLEIIVGNFNDIKFEEKFDYITLIGVLEYASSFTNTSNPMYDFLCEIKKLLKPNGRILIAIENRMGLKYLCGSCEDHTSMPYSGINGYNGISNVETLDKIQMIKLIETLNMKYHFYYPFPDYKFPEIVITDKFISNNYDLIYMPYYSSYEYLSMQEEVLFNNLNKLDVIDKFSNSFLIELSNSNLIDNIEFIKFQNIRRKDTYQLATIVKNDVVIKYPLCDNAIQFLKEVNDNHKKLKKFNNNYCGLLENNQLVFKKLKYKKLIDIIFDNRETFNKYFDKLVEYIYKSSKKQYNDNNIFTKFNLKIKKEKLNEMTFLKIGYLDLTFFNAFVNGDDNLIFIDQEWACEYVPVEYIIYRNLQLISLCDKNHIIDVGELIKKYKIDIKLFQELETKFTKSIFHRYSQKLANNYELVDVRNTALNYSDLKKEYEICVNSHTELIENYAKLEGDRNRILESKIVLDSEKASILKKYAEIEIINEKLNEKNAELNEKNEKLMQEKEDVIVEFKNVSETLQGIYNSRTWKTIDKIKGILKAFRRR